MSGPRKGVPAWRLGVAASEGLRNWSHGRWLTLTLTVIITALLAVPAVADASTVSRLLADERAWVAAGGRVLIATNDEAGGIPRRSCDAASGIDGVSGAVALSRLDARVGLRNAPGADIPVVAAGEGVGDLLRLGSQPTGAVIPAQVADKLGVAAGDSLWLTTSSARADASGLVVPTGPVPVSHVSRSDVLGDDYGHVIILPTMSTGMAQTCFVEVEAGHLDATRAALPALLASNGADAVVGDRLIGGSFGRDFSAEYADRVVRHAPWAVGVAVTLIWLLVSWVRRGREGLYATLGADGPVRAIIALTEGWVLLLSSAAAATIGTFVVLTVATPDVGSVAGVAARHLVIATLVAAVGMISGRLVPLRSPLSALKDR